VVTSSTCFANVGALATSASVPLAEAHTSVSTVLQPAAIATAALAAFFAPYLQGAAPLPTVPPPPVNTAVLADARDTNDALSSWLEQHGAEHYQMSLSSGEISAFDPVPNTSAGYSAPHVSARPTLQARDAVNVAHSTLGMEEAQLLVPSILRNFETHLTSTELAERMQWLWLMRHEVASQVRDTILLGRVRRQRPEAILRELLELAELLASDIMQ